MKRLNELFIQDKFRFAKQEREKLGFEQNDIFTVLDKYIRDRVSVRNMRTMEKLELSGTFPILPEPGNRQGKVITEEKFFVPRRKL